MATQANQHITGGHSANEHLERGTRSFVDEVYKLLDEPLEPEAFYREIIVRAMQPLGAANAAVWRSARSAPPSLICQTGLEQETLFRSSATQQQHRHLVSELFRDRRARSVPLVVATSDSANTAAVNYVLHLQPVVVDNDVVAAFQLIRTERPGDEAGQQTSWLLMTLAAIAGAFHHIHDVRHKRQANQLLARFEEFVRAIHASLNPKEIALAIANNGPPLLDCDRIFVLLRRGAKYRVVAVTGQSTIQPRANAVRNAERLMKAVPTVDLIVRYPDDTATFSPQEIEASERYLDETHAKSVVICFFSPESRATDKPSAGKQKIIGGLIAEKYDGNLLPGSELSRVKVLAGHCTQAIQNANAHHGVFLLPLWTTLGRLSAGVRNHVWKSALVLFCIVAAVLALVRIPADFELIARGTLQPDERRHIYAGIDGTIDELLVHEGQNVARDEVLARMSNPQLDLELEKVGGELRTTNEKLVAIKSSRLGNRNTDRSSNTADQTELAAQEEELRHWSASLLRQQSLVEQQRRNLLVRSPLAGKVITWNIDPTLRNRPVQRGQLLMTVANLDGPWGLELYLPDRHAGHFLQAREDFDRPLDVEFTLATDPNERIVGQVKRTALSIQTEDQEGVSLLVNAEFDRSAVKFLQPGATVTAKIQCGRRPLGYVWLHDLWEFIQYRVLFRF